MTTSAQVWSLYKQFRQAGMVATMAIDAARVEIRWDRLRRAGLVALWEEVEQENYFDVYGEPDSEKERQAIETAIQREGLSCVVGYYSMEPLCGDDEWEQRGEIGDSIGMCIYNNPTDPRENWYVTDIKAATIDALVAALKARCPVCRH